MERLAVAPAQMRELLVGEGGLAGISGIPGGDVRDLQDAADQGNDAARLALDTFAYQIRKTIGAYAAAMAGIDALVFTGGIGENSVRLRAGVCEGLEFLGIRLDPVENASSSGDRVISYADRPVKVVVLATNEEIVVGRETYRFMTGELSNPTTEIAGSTL
jgi:acetate kinase